MSILPNNNKVSCKMNVCYASITLLHLATIWFWWCHLLQELYSNRTHEFFHRLRQKAYWKCIRIQGANIIGALLLTIAVQYAQSLQSAPRLSVQVSQSQRHKNSINSLPRWVRVTCLQGLNCMEYARLVASARMNLPGLNSPYSFLFKGKYMKESRPSCTAPNAET